MQTQLGEFNVLEQLGEGGMGCVYRGYQPSLDREVAIKVLSEKIAENETFVARFQREARAAASLVHPNVIQIFSIGQEEDTHYFAMEYVRGQDLAQHLMEGRTFSLAESVEITMQVVQALCAASEVGLVHRDIKPSNIMMTDRGMVKITDFGLAKTTDSNLTDVGTIVGTANYMSPEQGMGKPLDGRSDIYSLGIVFYELVTGRPPFLADAPAAVLYKHAYEEPTPPSRINPDLSPELDALILRMIAKDPADRFPTPDELLAGLRALHVELAGSPLALPVGSGTAPSRVEPAPSACAATDTEKTLIVDAEAQPVRTALIADDVASVRSYLSAVLTEKQFRVLEAPDGESAVQQAVAEQPDLVLLDLDLPKLNGLQVLAELDRRSVDSAVIVISGNSEPAVVEQAMRHAISGYLAKPVNIHELRSRIDEALQQGAADSAESAPAATPAAEPALAPGQRYILVFDDNSYSQFLFRQLLNDAGHHTASTGAPEQARAILTEDLPDLLIVSTRLGDDAGLEMIQWVRDEKFTMPVLVVADEGDTERRARLQEWGLGPVLTRPVRVDELRNEIERALEGSTLAPKGAMTSNSFTRLMQEQQVRDNFFTVFDFARQLLGEVPASQRARYEKDIADKPARAVSNLVLAVLKRVAESQGSEPAMRHVRAAYKKGNFETRHLCLLLLRMLLPPEEEGEILGKIVTDEDYRMRIRVLQRMGELKQPSFADLAVRFLNDEVWKVRYAAAECLTQLGPQVAFEPLAVFFARSQTPLPEGMRRQLLDHRNPAVLAKLEDLARHGPPEVRTFAADLLGQLGTVQAVPVLLERLQDEHAAARAAAAKALGPLSSPKITPALFASLTDPNSAVQTAVGEALLRRKLGPGPAALVQALIGRGRRISPGAAAVVEHFQKHPLEFESALRDLGGQTPETRKVLSLLLKQIAPDEKTLAAVVQDLSGQDPARRDRAIKAILKAITPQANG